MQVSQDKVIFTFAELYTKSRKQNDKPLEMILSKQTLDVRGCIMAYLERTTTFRNQENNFLRSFVKPQESGKPCTVAGWLKNLLKEVGFDIGVYKAHSTRGACTSKNNNYGLSVKQIMQKANWK